MHPDYISKTDAMTLLGCSKTVLQRVMAQYGIETWRDPLDNRKLLLRRADVDFLLHRGPPAHQRGEPTTIDVAGEVIREA